MGSYSVPAASEVIVYAVSLDSDKGPEVMVLVRTFSCRGKKPNSDELRGHGLARVIGKFKGEFQTGPQTRS